MPVSAPYQTPAIWKGIDLKIRHIQARMNYLDGLVRSDSVGKTNAGLSVGDRGGW